MVWGGDVVSSQSLRCSGVVVRDSKKSGLRRAHRRGPDPAWDLGVEGVKASLVIGIFKLVWRVKTELGGRQVLKWGWEWLG